MRAGRPFSRHHSGPGVPGTTTAGEAHADIGSIAVRAAAAGVDAVVILDVARVGTQAGLDFELIRRVRERVPGVMLLAGGGVRGPQDVGRLHAVGCDGALVATAFHNGAIGPAEIACASQRKFQS